MPIPFFKYLKTKDRYCIAYFGSCDEYLVQLLYLRKHIEKQLPGLEVHLACRDKSFYVMQGCPNVMPWSIFKESKKEFGHVQEIGTDMIEQPILKLMKESRLDFPSPPPIKETNRRCLLWSKGVLPTRSIETEKIPLLKSLLAAKGYEVVIDQAVDFGCVAGVESELLYSSAIRGLMTYLVPTGIGTELYRQMFPNRGVLEKI